MPRTLLVVILGALVLSACPPSTPTPQAPTPPTAPVITTSPATAATAKLKLLCAEIWVITSHGGSPTKEMPLENMAAEGAHADVYVDKERDMMRIDVGLLGETTRQQVDLRFQSGKLICAREFRTSIHTILGGTESGPPPYWREDFRVFDDKGAVVHSTFDEAPGPDESHRTPEETIALAKEVLALVSSNQ